MTTLSSSWMRRTIASSCNNLTATRMSYGRKGSRPGEFHYPRAILVVGSLSYIVDSWNHRVQVFKLPSFQFQFEFGGFGSGAGQFFCPCSITFSDPWVIVADTNNARLSFHLPDGKFLFSSVISGIDFRARFAVRMVRSKFNTKMANGIARNSIRDQRAGTDRHNRKLLYDCGSDQPASAFRGTERTFGRIHRLQRACPVRQGSGR